MCLADVIGFLSWVLLEINFQPCFGLKEGWNKLRLVLYLGSDGETFILLI